VRAWYSFDGKVFVFNLGKTDIAGNGQARYLKILRRFVKDLARLNLRDITIKFARLDFDYPKIRYVVRFVLDEEKDKVRVIMTDPSGHEREYATEAYGIGPRAVYEEIELCLFEDGKWRNVPVYVNEYPVVILMKGKRYSPECTNSGHKVICGRPKI